MSPVASSRRVVASKRLEYSRVQCRAVHSSLHAVGFCCGWFAVVVKCERLLRFGKRVVVAGWNELRRSAEMLGWNSDG